MTIPQTSSTATGFMELDLSVIRKVQSKAEFMKLHREFDL